MPITFEDALAILSSRVQPLGKISSARIQTANGRILAEDLVATDDYPRFDNSSVDGYVLTEAKDASKGVSLPVHGTAAAGQSTEFKLTPGSAVQIFTGAAVPAGAYAVLMQEDAELHTSPGGFPMIELKAAASFGENIRRKGAEIQIGNTLLKRGDRLNAGSIALLALEGVGEVKVFNGPRVSLVCTGDELVDHTISPGINQIRDTSLPMVASLLDAFGASTISTHRVADDRQELRGLLLRLASESDLVVVTGGVSVGGRDFLPEVLREVGEVVFHGVSMRPGKPMLFGEIDHVPVLGLPGNPASSFVACHTFVRETVRVLSGEEETSLFWIEARLADDHVACGREDFVRVVLEWQGQTLWADPKNEQASYGLRSLATGQGLARLSARETLKRGDSCQVLLLR
jgi:molybdopterin molybdotransferase